MKLKKTASSGKIAATNGKTVKPRRTTAAKTDKAAAKESAAVKTGKAADKEPVATTKVNAAASKPKPAMTSNARRFNVPPILMEGDAPAPPSASGPGRRYSLGPTPPGEHFIPAAAALPDSYGTKKLFLTARDPHWLYAHWDFSRDDLKKYNALSIDGHLVLRVYLNAIAGEPLEQIHVHPESRNWFVPVPSAACKYIAEVGYYGASNGWVGLAQSGATLTPPDSLADDTSVRFATIPTDIPFTQLLALIKTAMRESIPLAEAMQQLRAEGFKNLPATSEIIGEWTPTQEKALASVVSMDQVRRVWIGSLEITELIRRQLEQQASSITAAQFGLPSSWGGSASVSSPFGGQERHRGFWFNVNAELIIYGATEPDATVTIGDRKIKLRPDGSFSFRFSLPDGKYPLPVAAHSADGEETREAKLHFSRDTKYHGDVGAHPQDKQLKPPVAGSVAA